MEIPEIKQRLSIETVLKHYGLKADRHGLIKCPFHEDQEPSLKIYSSTNTFNCFGCGAAGDVIEFIERYEKRGKHEAILPAQTLISGMPSKKASLSNHLTTDQKVTNSNTDEIIAK